MYRYFTRSHLARISEDRRILGRIIIVFVLLFQVLTAFPAVFAVTTAYHADVSGTGLTSTSTGEQIGGDHTFLIVWRNIPSNRTFVGVKPQIRANGKATTLLLVASTNWSGYAISTGGKPKVNSIAASWIVPMINSSSPKPAYSATWIGVGGYSDNTLIQTGTEQDIDAAGNTQYYAWYELLPATEVPLFPVSPGDAIIANVTYIGSNNWKISLVDSTAGASSSFEVSYKSSFGSADWIHEATSLCSKAGCKVQTLSATSDIAFSSAYATIGSTTDPIAAFSDVQIVMDDGTSALHIAAEPGCLPSEDRFAVSYTDNIQQSPILVDCFIDSSQYVTYTTQEGTFLSFYFDVYVGYNELTFGLDTFIRPSANPNVQYEGWPFYYETYTDPYGLNSEYRVYQIPAPTTLGTYDWKVTLWSGQPNTSTRFTTSGWSNGGIQVTQAYMHLDTDVLVGEGTVSPSCPGYSCVIPVGQNVSVTAFPAAGWSFSGWHFGTIVPGLVQCPVMSNPCNFTMPDGSEDLYAQFTVPPRITSSSTILSSTNTTASTNTTVSSTITSASGITISQSPIITGSLTTTIFTTGSGAAGTSTTTFTSPLVTSYSTTTTSTGPFQTTSLTNVATLTISSQTTTSTGIVLSTTMISETTQVLESDTFNVLLTTISEELDQFVDQVLQSFGFQVTATPVGRQVNRVAVTFNPPNQQNVNLTLQQGWNLVSLPVVPHRSDIGAVLWPVMGKVVVVWSYSSATKTWVFFEPGPPVSGTLKSMTDGNAYWVYATVGGTFNVTGSAIPAAQSPPSYPLNAGWNLLGFEPQPYVSNETVAQYLSSINGKYDPHSVWVYVNSEWVRADPSYMLEPGQAMWIFMTAPATLQPR